MAHQLNKHRDIRLILSCFVEANAALLALLRILSCFLEASAALLGQVQVCILVWRISRAPSSLTYVLLFSIKKNRDIRLIALLRVPSCFLEALLGQVQVCKQMCRDICLIALLRILSCLLEASAALLSQVQVSGASALSSLKCVHFVLDKQIYRDIRLIALVRILSCFLEASAAILGQAQVCIVLAHQQSPVEP